MLPSRSFVRLLGWILLLGVLFVKVPALRAQATTTTVGSGLVSTVGVYSPFTAVFSSVAATGTQTATVRLPNLSTFFAGAYTGNGITGAPAGCQFTFARRSSAGGPTETPVFSTQAFTPTNGFVGFVNTVITLSGYSAEQAVVVYTCTTYPTAGTFSLTLQPWNSQFIMGVGNDALATMHVVHTGPNGKLEVGTMQDTPSNSSSTSAANTANTTTLAAGAANNQWVLRNLEVFLSAAGTCTLTVQDGATTVWSHPVGTFTAGAPYSLTFASGGLTGSSGNAMTITVGACGAGITSTVNIVADQQ